MKEPAEAAPLLLITMGDVAGVGPEIVARAWPRLFAHCRPVVVGDPIWLRRGLDLVGGPGTLQLISRLADAAPAPDVLPCLAASDQHLSGVRPGRVSAAAGRAAYDFLCRAIDETKAGAADGVVTAPLHKEGLHAAGLHYPGHTEILAERCGVREFAMVLAVEGWRWRTSRCTWPCTMCSAISRRRRLWRKHIFWMAYYAD
jgi:4-hydroxythreonine-4-phosphate dehydrogenase